mgnify:CR=1 FL=1
MLCVFGVAIACPFAFITYNLGLTPEKGTTELVLFLCIPLFFISTLSIMGNMTRDSMIGDIADEVELHSGKRQEGVLYSAVSFIQKVMRFDYILLSCILLLGIISSFAMYTTDGGEILFHSRSHISKFLILISIDPVFKSLLIVSSDLLTTLPSIKRTDSGLIFSKVLKFLSLFSISS